MALLHRWLLTHGTGRNVTLAVVAVCVLFAAFAPLILWFQQQTAGFMPFDNQFPLTPAMMAEQLRHYTDGSRGYYAGFAAVDMLFPPVFSLFFALLWAWLLRGAPASQPILANRLLWLPFVSAGFDWIENFGNIWIIYGAGPEPVYLLMLAFKYAKLCAVAINIGVAIWLAGQRQRAD